MRRESFHKLLEELGGERRINYGLDRFRKALQSLGNPEKDVHSLVIAGTNGKGTTTLLVSAALLAAGYRVGTYLSPHLQSPAERFAIGLEPIDEGELAELGLEHAGTARQFELSYFEFLTLLSFIWSRRKGCQFQVLEVGLGGRLDATNVTDPIASAITNIALDHQVYLGDTREAILEEKLGVLRPEGLLFTGIREPELLDRVEKRCLELDAVYYFSKELSREVVSLDWNRQKIRLNDYPFELASASPGAVENAALAFLLLRIAFPRLSIDSIADAFRGVRNPGRLEVVSERPRVVLSGDHNLAGVACLKAALEKLPHGRVHTVCALSPDKPAREMVDAIAAFSDEITLTEVSRFRGKMPENYRRLAPFVEDPFKAVERAVEKASPEDTVLVTGSLYLVGEVRKLWRSKVEYWRAPPPAPLTSASIEDGATPAKAPPTGAARNPAR